METKIDSVALVTLYKYNQIQLNIPKSESYDKIKGFVNEIGEVDKDIDYEIKIGVKRKKRSLNANSYAWHLISEIANVLRADKDELYLMMLRRYGQSEIVSVREDVNVSGYFKYYDVFGTGKIKGKKFTHYKIYKGTSEYNSKEMSVFIDGLVSEARELNIETLDDKKIKELVKV